MKSLVYTAPEKVELLDRPQPSAGPGQAVIDISATGICGSDISGFLGHSARRKPGLVLGHEAVGRVREDAGTWKKGQRVCINPLSSCGSCRACLEGRQNICASWKLLGLDEVQGTFAEQVAVGAGQLIAIPDGMRDEDAVMTEPLANIVHLFRLAWPELPSSLAIFGGGTMGALALAYAKLRKVPQVFVVDKSPERLATAKTLGADSLVDAGKEDAIEKIKALSGGEGAAAVLDAVGAGAVRKACMAACRRGGRVLFLGLQENESSLPFIDMIRNEQQIYTSFAFTPPDFAGAFEILRSGQLQFGAWTETRSMDEGQASFMKMAKNPGSTLKLVFKR